MLKLTLVTPEKKIVLGQEAVEISVPAFKGELNILAGHAPLITTLEPGILKYKLQGEEDFKKMAISWGYCQVSPIGINILAETAELAEEIDIERSRAAIVEHQTALATQTMDDFTWNLTQMKLKKAMARIEIAQSK